MDEELKPAGSHYLPGNITIARYLGETVEPMYHLLEWSTDHAREGWWRHSEVMDVGQINCGSEDPQKWHAEAKQQSTYTEAYHADWNALMRAYQKMQADVSEKVNMDPRMITFCMDFISGILNNDQPTCWQAVVAGIDFINQYNSAIVKQEAAAKGA